MEERTLDTFKPSMKGRIKKIEEEGALRRRLFDMGITPSAEIVMRKSAPLGDPIEIVVRGYELAIRKDIAKKIVVEVIE